MPLPDVSRQEVKLLKTAQKIFILTTGDQALGYRYRKIIGNVFECINDPVLFFPWEYTPSQNLLNSDSCICKNSVILVNLYLTQCK